MLQSLNMIGYNRDIDAADVYNFTGNPSPVMLNKYLNTLMQDSFK